MRDPEELIHRYLDDALDEDEQESLQQWLKSSPENLRAFTSYAFLHDQIHNQMSAHSVVNLADRQGSDPSGIHPGRLFQRRVIVTLSAIAASLLMFAAWHYFELDSVSTAAELHRLIDAQKQIQDCTYKIFVEEIAKERSRRALDAQWNRPPKPPMNDATLYLRQSNQFVLIRQTSDGERFITGSNGTTSWAIRPDRSLKTSRDLTEFSRDLPGHEHHLPLMDLEATLITLQKAYVIQVLPPELDSESLGDSEPSRLLVAIKKRGYPGPQRVEISYSLNQRQIRQIRFVEMPYGSERLTLRLTLIDQSKLSYDFFESATHLRLNANQRD